GGLWQPSAPAPRDLVTVLARLAALVGADNLGSPAVVDSHRSDAFAMLAFSPPSDAESSESRFDGDAPGTDRMALRRMRPPRRVEVETAGERPVRVDARLVMAAAGPWGGSGRRGDPQARAPGGGGAG